MDRRELLGRVFEPHPASPGPVRYTNAVLRTHNNEEVKFYNDLIRGKQCVVNFMYAECHGSCPVVTQTLKTIYRELKDRMGKDLFFYSISLKPEEDTPAALKHYAETRNADLPGWYFLTGDPHDIQTIRFRLFGMDHPAFDSDETLHSSYLRIINDGRNSWGMAQAFATNANILKRISWQDPPKSYSENVIEVRKRQIEIVDEIKKYGYRRGGMN
ncbi:MAG TPA: SCO family protein [Pyrinomonadaceae bacterium]|jgi:protein SCO1/2|nr:SCO family protein [Pyrinomonadaceae bacterium]